MGLGLAGVRSRSQNLGLPSSGSGSENADARIGADVVGWMRWRGVALRRVLTLRTQCRASCRSGCHLHCRCSPFLFWCSILISFRSRFEFQCMPICKESCCDALVSAALCIDHYQVYVWCRPLAPTCQSALLCTDSVCLWLLHFK